MDSSDTVQPVRQPPRDAREEAYIFRLPDELLHHILSLALGLYHPPFTRRKHMAIIDAPLVCKRFYEFAQTALYQTIDVSERFQSLSGLCYRTIKENPQLGAKCQTFKCCINDYHIANRELHDDLILNLLPNLRRLEVKSTFAKSWPLVCSAVNDSTPPLHTLELQRSKGHEGPLYLRRIYSDLNVHRLQTLIIRGLEPRGGAWHSEVADEPEVPGEEPALEISEQDQYTAKFRHLCLIAFHHLPSDLAAILAWPRALESFIFWRLTDECHKAWSSVYTLAAVQDALRAQRMTLRSIKICQIKRGDGPIDVTDFPVLEKLRLPAPYKSCSPAVAASTVLVPKLHTLVFDDSEEGEDHSTWKFLPESQMTWLREFAQITRTQHGQQSLRKICIRFHPHLDTLTWFASYKMRKESADMDELVSHWERLEELRRNLADEWGLSLEYDYLEGERLEWESEFGDSVRRRQGKDSLFW